MLFRAISGATCAIVGLTLAACGPSRQEVAAEHGATIRSYCLDCHNDTELTGGLTLESLDLSDVGSDAEVWEHVVRKLRAGMMPPHDGGPRPAAERSASLVTWLESELDQAAAMAPNPGRVVPLHRLNRAEYRNAVRDLLAVDVDVSSLLPGDDASYGFDNIAGVLNLSPTLLERYLSAADRVSRLAVGTESAAADIDYFRVPDDRSQERRLPGLPFGTRGGIVIDHMFPQDGEYLISAELARDLNEGMPVYTEPQHLEVSVDRQRVALFTLEGATPIPPRDADPDGFLSAEPISLRLPPEQQRERNQADEDWAVRVPVPAGRHEVTVTFLAKAGALQETARKPFERPYPRGLNIPEGRTGSYLRSVEISGPYEAAGPGHTASRARIFVCRPESESARPTPESEKCAKTIIAQLARRAYRRPVRDADIAPLLDMYRVVHEEDGKFDLGIQHAAKLLLVSPEFLFRFEPDPPDVAPGSSFRVPDIQLASRLSFFLWSSIPDDELLEVAEQGRLSDPTELERQVQRMIADPRSEAFVENFAGQWLYLRNLDATIPVQSVFPNFDDTLRQGLRRETELFFASVLRENRSVRDLLRADYTYVNERVAEHYGIRNIKGSHFRRVTLPPDNPRRGLLGHGSVLAVTSQPDRTSPVLRGKWVLENLLGAEPPPPPPNVPPLEATGVTDAEGMTLSMRERLAVHRENPTCASCHTLMDSLGFALEGFDAVGRSRTLDDVGDPIDASGILPDGRSFEGFGEFREALVSSELFPLAVVEKLMTYALGRGVEHYDLPAVRKIVRDAAGEDYRLSDFILGVVNSTPFQMQRSAI